MKSNLAPLMSSAKNDWETPESIFKPLNEEFGFTIDLAADAGNHKVAPWFGPDSPLWYGADALSIPWTGYRGWLNPPYGRGLKQWIQKAYDETRESGTIVVMLIPARTDTSYWHDYVMKAEEIRYLRGRITFVGAKSCAPFPSAVVVFGRK